jgi:hypothetical protein
MPILVSEVKWENFLRLNKLQPRFELKGRLLKKGLFLCY